MMSPQPRLLAPGGCGALDSSLEPQLLALSSEEGSVPGNENAINQLETQQTRVPTAAGSQAADHGTVIRS